MAKKKARALTKTTKQTGISNIKRDLKFKALSPGKRRSKKGKIYYEYRKNRSDVKGRDTPLTKKQIKKIKNSDSLKKKRIAAYKKKQEIKKKKLEYLAKKTKQASHAAWEQSNKAVSMIPFGQPILVGHHSERTHRAAIKRSHIAMDKSVKLSKMAEKYEERLKSMENNYAISSDDPEAVKKLKQKVSILEKQRERIKEQNKKNKKVGRPIEPRFVLSNLGQNINSIKKRIKYLQSMEKIKPSSKVIKGVKIINNKEVNRIQLEFPDKPNAEIRTILKQNGFRWSPSQNRWQRMLNNAGSYAAKRVLEKL